MSVMGEKSHLTGGELLLFSLFFIDVVFPSSCAVFVLVTLFEFLHIGFHLASVF